MKLKDKTGKTHTIKVRDRILFKWARQPTYKEIEEGLVTGLSESGYYIKLGNTWLHTDQIHLIDVATTKKKGLMRRFMDWERGE